LLLHLLHLTHGIQVQVDARRLRHEDYIRILGSLSPQFYCLSLLCSLHTLHALSW
jgi:hypothetical protein